MLRIPDQVTLQDLAAIFTRYAPAIEDALMAAVPSGSSESDGVASQNLPFVPDATRYPGDTGLASLAEFYGMLRYHMGWLDERLQQAAADSGKKLRPIICLLCNEASGGDYHAALPAVAAIELVHNFSLIHDDIEDRSDQRRHRDTVWKLWGEPVAINAGDAMFILARLALLRLQMPAGRVLLANQVLEQTCLRLTEGQYLDMAAESRLDISEARYLTMIGRKTAALIDCCCRLGALIADGEPALIEAYRQFGMQLGLAFQIRDDVLGIWGAAEDTGKPGADDLWKRKKTLPVIYALEHANDAEREQLKQIYAAPDLSAQDVQAIIAILDRTGAREYTQQIARQFGDQALQQLEHAITLRLPQSEKQRTAQQDLATLAVFSFKRNK